MEYISTSLKNSKIIPLARKKLLAQALMNDSPVKVSLKNRKFRKNSANSSSSNLENLVKLAGYSSVIVSPLREKDINHEDSKLKAQLTKNKEKKIKGKEK